MTAAFLQSELLSLISDSKRKQSDVRTSAEKSLADLKAISVTSETQLAGDLLRKQQFIDPFVLACNSKYTKLAVTGTICLQRLVASKAVPRGRLVDVLDAFHEASSQGLDVQLKILQALPSLLQLYANELHGEPLAKILSLCAGLAASKTGMVSSTAEATFQQLITSVFERKKDESLPPTTEDDNATEISSNDAVRVFGDMCLVASGAPTQFLRVQGMSPHLAFEVIENCVANEESELLGIPQCMESCEQYLIPGIAEQLQRSNNFMVFSQCLRVTILLATYHLDALHEGLAEVFHFVLDWMDRGTGASWKRILCVEAMRDVCSDFKLLRTMFAAFDQTQGRRRVIQDLMAILVRIAAEDPSLIGLGRQSTVPTNSVADNVDSSGTIDVQGFDAVGSVMQANTNVTGISTRWSMINTPLLSQIERSNAPDIPETYVYTLVLACVAAFSDGLSKFVMPLSVPTRSSAKNTDADGTEDNGDGPERKNGQRGQKYQRLLNPLKRDDLPQSQEVRISANVVEECWPAILATCSTFLNSALDSHFYHILVRTVQKLAQVSGILELHTPRDALLTTLAKVSVPLNAASLVAIHHGNRTARRYDADVDSGEDSASIKSPVQSTPRPSVDVARQTLNVRHLLCLRALLNLGIALGPTLSATAWFIVLQTLQQVEALMSVSPTAKSAVNTPNPQSTEGDGQNSLATEIAAVGTASKRMIESTRSYPDTTLEVLVRSVFKMIDDLTPFAISGPTLTDDSSQTRPGMSSRVSAAHKSSRSISGVPASSAVLKVEVEFVLKTISDISRVNIHRFASRSSKACSWDLVATRLLHIVAGNNIDPTLRIQAATTVDVIAMEVAKLLEKYVLQQEELDALQQACLAALSKQLGLLYKPSKWQQDNMPAEIEIHRRLLEALENIVSHTGDSLTRGWRIVFDILQVTIHRATARTDGDRQDLYENAFEEITLRTVTPAFRTIQLVVSDFLGSIDPESLWVLIQLLPLFGTQEHDLNISLTTATLFWNVNGLILERTETLSVTESLRSDELPVNNPDSIFAAENSTLWFATTIHLAELCNNHRKDIRNGAIHVLLRIFNTSSEKLTSEMWNMSMTRVCFPLLQRYSANHDDQSGWHDSFSQLLAGVVDLFVHHTEAIVEFETFKQTWVALVSVLEGMLIRMTLAGHKCVYEAMIEILNAMIMIKMDDESAMFQILKLWLTYHPASIQSPHEENGSALVAHARVFDRFNTCNQKALSTYSDAGKDIDSLAMNSIKLTIMSCIHGRYADDVRKMAPEQEISVSNLTILSSIMFDSRRVYCEFLQELIKNALARHTDASSEVTEQNTKIKHPTLVAFMVKCVELLGLEVPTKTRDASWISDIAAPTTIMTLSDVVRTKYSRIPCTNVQPAWQVATTVVVQLVQAISRYTATYTANDIVGLSSPIVTLADVILTAPELETTNNPPAEEKLLEDEAFDIEQFIRLHEAIVSILHRPHFPEEKQRQYTVVLFRSSQITKPWFGDLPPNLLHDPLARFKVIRAGSIRKPDFYLRTKIGYKALDALFGLVSNPTDPASDGDLGSSALVASKSAAPYVLLRVAQTIKTFLADQTLRYLIPPPRPLQRELRIIITKALTLRCRDEAFAALPGLQNSPQLQASDGKSHLRLLYPFILQLRELWNRTPRLKVCAWQEDEDGLAVEKALSEWDGVIAGDLGVF